MKLMIALGGNAIKQAHEIGSSDEQFENCDIASGHIARIISHLDTDDRVIITHGNGPQAGNLLVQQDMAKNEVPPHPLDVVGAMTQGQVGYMLQQTLSNHLNRLNLNIPVLAVINRVLVNKDDPEFFGDAASKPVGNFFNKIEADKIKQQHPEYIMKEVKPNTDKSWRRAVPSPDPMRNVESDGLRKMVESGIIVIASGGGGIPVIIDENGAYEGIEAVIDKDLAGQILASLIGADTFLVLTDIEKVMLNYGRSNEEPIREMTVLEAEEYLKEGHFLEGSMSPKVRACIRFIRSGGKQAVVTSLDKGFEGLQGKTGTQILQNN
jgi:carbamate kinase